MQCYRVFAAVEGALCHSNAGLSHTQGPDECQWYGPMTQPGPFFSQSHIQGCGQTPGETPEYAERVVMVGPRMLSQRIHIVYAINMWGWQQMVHPTTYTHTPRRLLTHP